jgi:hypothetical protein
VRRIGFFAPGGEGLFVLTGSETLSLWHTATAQCLNSHTVNLPRERLGCDYLVDCSYDVDSGKLLLLAGDWAGNLTVAEVSDAAVAPVAHLRGGGHCAVVRSALWGGGHELWTGGEDARVCRWSLGPSAQQVASPGSKVPSRGTSRGASRGPEKNRGGGGRGSGRSREAAPY